MWRSGLFQRLILVAAVATARLPAATLSAGETFQLGERLATLTTIDTLPYVDDEYTRRFRFDAFDNPRLAELRTRYQLDSVVAPANEEFERQVLLNDWSHAQFARFGRPSTNVQGALDVLNACQQGHTFFCRQYAEVLLSAAASLGWVGRPLALRRHQGVNQADGSTEHAVIELWSNQYRKWVMWDPTSKLYLERHGTPLNAFEIRQEWFYRQGSNLTFVIGKERQRRRTTDLPIPIKDFPEFGRLAVHPDELDKYGFIGYIPNNDLMDSGYAYDRMFITKDTLCDQTSWHVRQKPARPDLDPYFPVGQAAMELHLDRGTIQVRLRTLTPNFDRYERRQDGGDWERASADFEWRVRPGTNQLEARTVNRFGVPGPTASARCVVNR
ncbi:MAG: hypothetical protein JNK85_20775 [Verrucomicrobiales bacterium]|nr:hypothetical protein [Verrucomicrobiales bacterium]